MNMNPDRCNVEPWMAQDLNNYVPPGSGASLPSRDCEGVSLPPSTSAQIEDRWIFHRINECAKECNRAIETFRYHEAAQSVWRFFWNEFCDWYVEPGQETPLHRSVPV